VGSLALADGLVDERLGVKDADGADSPFAVLEQAARLDATVTARTAVVTAVRVTPNPSPSSPFG
jgi:hypothetical protein